MFRIFVKNRRQVDFLIKCTSVQPISTAPQMRSQDQNGKEKILTSSVFDKVKKGVINASESLKEWKYREDGLSYWSHRKPRIPEHCDVLVIGGGAIGSSVAYWLKQKVFKDMKVIVVERDPTYAKASTSLSVGGLRQQFSLPENIEMSLFGAEFIRNVNHYLGIDKEPPVDPCFHPYGYLVLASRAGAETLAKNSRLQNSLGAKNILLSAEKLRGMFPWLSTEGIEVGCLGLEKEGWFDPWSLLCGLKRKAAYLGAEYIHAEAKGFVFQTIDMTDDEKRTAHHQRLQQLIIETPEGETREINFAIAVVAAGAFSADIARMANVGTGEGIFKFPLPVEPRKRYVYCFHCPDGPGLNTPLTIDPTGTYFRRDGLAGNFLCGRSPSPDEEPSIEDLSVDHDFFNEKVWPMLAKRVQAFESLKVKSSWAGYYEYNTFDKNGIVGPHPYFSNLIFATGFSGHGIQQSPAVGRAVAELIVNSRYMTIDLSKLGFDRFIVQERMLEANIF